MIKICKNPRKIPGDIFFSSKALGKSKQIEILNPVGLDLITPRFTLQGQNLHLARGCSLT
jgi:hypothetical protein